MLRIILVFGLISGAAASAMMWILTTLVGTHEVDFDNGMLFGYATMVIALSLVFFGIRAYREKNGGRITFMKGLQIGILITLISSLCYAASWEVYGDKDFVDEYTAYNIDKMKAAGAPEAEVEAARVQGEEFAEMYKVFYIRFGMTLMEILPVGIIVTLISAAILRNNAGNVGSGGQNA